MPVIVRKLPKSEIEIEGEIAADIFETYFTQALKKIGENFKLDGFRKGKIPESVLISKIPEISILEEMAEMALSEHYPKIIEEEKIDAISRPEISITKLARRNPLGFKIKTAVLPEIKLPEYKEIAKNILRSDLGNSKRSDFDVSDEDIENTIMDIRKSRAPKKHVATSPQPSPETGEGESELPEFNDEFVQALGPFKNVEDFKNKLKENIKLEKENQAKEKTRIKIVEKIIDESKLDVPEILIMIEIDKILAKMESDIAAMGLKFEDYLKHLNKTREDLRKEFRTDAEKKAKLSLILNEIAKIEKIVADEIEVEREVAHLLEHYKDADPERARMHVENVLTNEKIFQFLENQ
jgi:trigger factor